MPHHVVTGLRDLGFMSDENPRAAEELALLLLEDLLVVIDVRRDHAAPHVLEDRRLARHWAAAS